MIKLYTFLLLFIHTIVFGQNSKAEITLLNSESLEADAFYGFDSFHYAYYVKENVIYKSKGLENWQYKNIGLGKIAKIDIQNPLKIMVFYENFNTIVLLDNQLSEIQKINFNTLSEPIVVEAAGTASQNRIWIFNSTTKQLGLYDFQKSSYITISRPFNEIITHYQSDYNYFYWVNPKNELYSCDVFGRVSPLGIIPAHDTCFIQNNQTVFYQKDTYLYQFNTSTQESIKIDLGKKTFSSYSIKEQILSIFTAKEIVNYKITTP
jgi:hypothetical protein